MSYSSSQVIERVHEDNPTKALRVCIVDQFGNIINNFGGGGSTKTIQGTRSAPLEVDTIDMIDIDPANDEDIYIAGKTADAVIGWGNFDDTKLDGKILTFICKSNITGYRVTLVSSSSLLLNGDYYMRDGSIITLRFDGAFAQEVSRNGI